MDNPENGISAPYFESARKTTTELILCVLSNLDDQAKFKKDVTQLLYTRFQFMLRVPPSYERTTPNSVKRA